MSNNEILREFLLETHENLALLDSDLVKLETNPSEKATLAQVFRTLHSVKGTAGFMGLVKLQAIAHSAESLLSKLRAGEILFSQPIATALLRVVDAIREILSNVESSGGEGTGDYTALAAEVDRLREMGGSQTPAPCDTQLFERAVELPPRADSSPQPVPSKSPESRESGTLETLPSVVPETGTNELPALQATVSLTSSALTAGEAEGRTASVADAAIRVDVGLLDKLMTLVGELVLARNQILQHSNLQDQNGTSGAVQRLDLLTTELQASVMKTRMQPIGNVLNKFPRIVRDLSVACGKKVRFEMDGQDTELDKTLIEAIRDPLTHMIRNAVDHGIETPEVRRSHGKPEEGRLRMLAFHEGGKVIVEINDDGAGVDVARVMEKALAANLILPEAAARMSRLDLLRLVFLPGFSTADRVTQFSGRGVGMDVVRTNIEKIGGTVDIESTQGQGTTIRTKIPLTLAIIPALIVASGGERYAIPQVSLIELVRLEPDQAQRGIERMHGVPVYRLRGALLPLVFLDEQLLLATSRGCDDPLNIVVLQADDQLFGLVVDTIRDTEEIVVKPLQKQLKGVGVFSGAAIMGDGRVALVLDVVGLAQRAQVISDLKNRAREVDNQSTPSTIKETQPLLLFASRAGEQLAIPLSQVARLEEFPGSIIEKLGVRKVVQYRGEILPLIDVSQELDRLAVDRNESAAQGMPTNSPEIEHVSANDMIPVVVYANGDERVGLIVGKILDIVDDAVTTRSRSNRRGALFTSIVQEKVTEFLDVAALLREQIEKSPSAM